MPDRIPKKPPPVVMEWLRLLTNSLRARRIARPQCSEDTLVRVAGHLSLIGPSSDETAVKVYSALVQLLFAWRRVQQVTTNASHLPATAEGMRRVGFSILAASKVENFEQANFPVPQFITVAVQLPDPYAYVDVCRQGLPTIRAIFHPNTLKATAERYRGLVGSAVNSEHQAEVRSKVRSVS